MLEDKLVYESKMKSDAFEHDSVVFGLNEKIKELKIQLNENREQLAAAQKALVESLG